MRMFFSRLFLNIGMFFVTIIAFICHPIKFIKAQKEYKENGINV